MESDYMKVGAFHAKFDLEHALGETRPHLIEDSHLQAFRIKFMEEELREYKEAIANGDLPKAADALIDLSYVVLGTAHMHSLPWTELFDEVQRANMQKERCIRAEESLRGSTFDVIKPPGWTPPDIIGVLRRFGWNDK